MKILFVLPDTNYVEEYMPDYTGSFHLGLGYLSSVLKEKGHDCSLIHIKNESELKNIGERAKKYNPDLIAYTAFTHQFHLIRKASKEIKKILKKPSICGGVHATVDPEEVIKEPGIDIVCIGEGEGPILELVEKIKNKKSINKIRSLWIKSGKKIIKNPVAPLNQDLDSIPFPDRELFEFEKLSDFKLGVLNVIATRGCPFQCTYCINHQLQKIYAGKGKYVRFRNVDEVIKEVKEVYKKYPSLKYVELLDDTFCIDKNWVKEFTNKYEKEINLPFRANTHLSLLDEDKIKWLKRAGCERVAVGIESGNPKIRSKILNRHMGNKEIIEKIKMCKKVGLEVTTYNMVGLPFETIKNVLETVKLNADSGSTEMHVSIFQPYPNTELYNICKKNNLIKNKDVKTFFSGTVVRQKSISETEVNFTYKYFGIFARLYSLFRFYPINKALDKLFLSKSLHSSLIKIHPLIFTLVFPMKGTYRALLKRFPKTIRALKNKLVR